MEGFFLLSNLVEQKTSIFVLNENLPFLTGWLTEDGLAVGGCLSAGAGLEVLVGGVFVAVHLHAGHVPLLGAGGLVDLDETLQVQDTF